VDENDEGRLIMDQPAFSKTPHRAPTRRLACDSHRYLRRCRAFYRGTWKRSQGKNI